MPVLLQTDTNSLHALYYITLHYTILYYTILYYWNTLTQFINILLEYMNNVVEFTIQEYIA